MILAARLALALVRQRSSVVDQFGALAVGMVIHEIAHHVALRQLRPKPFRFAVCPHGIASTEYFQKLWKYEKVSSLSSGLHAEFGFGLILSTIGAWFFEGGSLVWSCVLLVATIGWWVRPFGSKWFFIVTAPWLLVLLTVVGFFGLAWGTSNSLFENLLCAGFAPMFSAAVNALPFEWSPNSDGTRIAKAIHSAPTED